MGGRCHLGMSVPLRECLWGEQKVRAVSINLPVMRLNPDDIHPGLELFRNGEIDMAIVDYVAFQTKLMACAPVGMKKDIHVGGQDAFPIPADVKERRGWVSVSSRDRGMMRLNPDRDPSDLSRGDMVTCRRIFLGLHFSMVHRGSLAHRGTRGTDESVTGA